MDWLDGNLWLLCYKLRLLHLSCCWGIEAICETLGTCCCSAFFIRISMGKVRKSSYFLKVSDSRFNFSVRIYFSIHRDLVYCCWIAYVTWSFVSSV